MPSSSKLSLKQAATFDEWKQHFAVALRKSPEDISVFRGEISVQIELEQLLSVLMRLKDETGGGNKKATSRSKIINKMATR